MINEYNKLIEKIVRKFAERFCKEEYNEDIAYYDIMNYVWISQWPVEISDYYFNIDDILISEMYQIPSHIFVDYYNLCLDSYTDKNKWPWINLYNYNRKRKDKALYDREKKEDLKRSEERVEKAKNELENIINKYK